MLSLCFEMILHILIFLIIFYNLQKIDEFVEEYVLEVIQYYCND